MSIVIVGAGLAGGTAATELREQGYNGPVVLVGAEEHAPYERPPLSKGYLLGNDPIDDAFVHPVDWYAEHDVDLRLGVEATAIDTDAHVVHTSSGDLTYERLLLATGAEPRRLALAEDSGVPTAYLRTIEDSDRLKAAFAEGGRIAVVGAGWIGLEAAAAARTAGCEVTVFETADLPLLRVLGPTVASAFADLHRSHGVDLRLGTQVTADDLAGADLVVAGIGVTPRVALAEAAGLAVDNGVLVDAGLHTSVPRACSPSATSPTTRTPCWGGGSGWSTGTPRSTRPRSPRTTSPAATRSTTRCPTSSPTSTTSAWSTSATPAPTTRSSCTATWPGWPSGRSGCATAGSSRRCTPTTGTRPTTCAPRWPPATSRQPPDRTQIDQ